MISPLPWLVVQNEKNNSIQILDSDGTCVVYDYGFLSLDDANFIVESVNQHDKTTKILLIYKDSSWQLMYKWFNSKKELDDFLDSNIIFEVLECVYKNILSDKRNEDNE